MFGRHMICQYHASRASATSKLMCEYGLISQGRTKVLNLFCIQHNIVWITSCDEWCMRNTTPLCSRYLLELFYTPSDAFNKSESSHQNIACASGIGLLRSGSQSNWNPYGRLM